MELARNNDIEATELLATGIEQERSHDDLAVNSFL